jgi:predicted transcriptional regulator
MAIQFVSNEKGEVTAVQVPIKEWQEIERRLKEKGQSEWQDLTPEEIASIEVGLADVEAGRVVSHEEVRRRSRELLNKRS